MKATIKNNILTIEIPLQAPAPDASGKTMVVATTRGFAKTDAKVNNMPISVSINATIGNK